MSSTNKFTLAIMLALVFILLSANWNGIGDLHAPGRTDHRLEKRAPKDYGTFQVNCAGSESACNNACFYINCQARNDPDANKIVYIGQNGYNGEDNRNRIESGCRAKNPSSGGGSACRNFPFSQKFSNPTADDWQCDEWPPALHQQPPFIQKAYANSLRCMPGGENGSLGGKLSAFIVGKATYPGRPVGLMDRDDFFRVDFFTKIGTANATKVPFCFGQTPACTSDGFQFGMTAKPLGGGKISASYDLAGNDNRYALQASQYKDLFQCGVEFSRQGDNDFKTIILTDWANSHVQTTNDCSVPTNGANCTIKGLPNDLVITRTGNIGTKIDFAYATNDNVNHFTWDSLTSGDGRGPWTDPASDPSRLPKRFCKVIGGLANNVEQTECWFPCYRNADGK